MFRLIGQAFIVILILSARVFPADLTYTFHYSGKPESPLIVDLRFWVDSSGPRQLLLPDRYGGQKEMWRSLCHIVVKQWRRPAVPDDIG
jgi:hypothetical protein